MRFQVISSGSSGNMTYIESDNAKLLLDAGISLKEIVNRSDVDLSKLDGILITHEHTDHIQSLGNLSKKFDLPVFATSGTFDAMPKQTERISETNKNCGLCTNCTNCEGCLLCDKCKGCKNCYMSAKCHGCDGCEYCNGCWFLVDTLNQAEPFRHYLCYRQ